MLLLCMLFKFNKAPCSGLERINVYSCLLHNIQPYTYLWLLIENICLDDDAWLASKQASKAMNFRK